MKLIQLKYLAIPVILLLAGCISVPVPDPTPEKNTLLAGKILVDVNTTGRARGVNDSYDFGIRVFFQNNDTGRETAISTHTDGWLITNALPAGNYTITQLTFTSTVSRTKWTFTLHGPYHVTIAEGMVNNIGSIEIEVGNERYSWRFISHDSVRNEFGTLFPDSEWNAYEWRNDNAFVRTAQQPDKNP